MKWTSPPASVFTTTITLADRAKTFLKMSAVKEQADIAYARIVTN